MALESTGPLVGLGPGLEFDTCETTLPEYARLFVFSDGAFEIKLPDGGTWTLAEFQDYLTARQTAPQVMDALLAHCYGLHGSESLDDDFSIVQFDFVGAEREVGSLAPAGM